MKLKLTLRGKVLVYSLTAIVLIVAIMLSISAFSKKIENTSIGSSNSTSKGTAVDSSTTKQPSSGTAEPTPTGAQASGNTQAEGNNNTEETQAAEPVIVEVTDNRAVLNSMKLSIFFGPNLTVLENQYIRALDLFAEAALAMDGAPIQIEGNCATLVADPEDDTVKDLNYKLSLRRAEVVYDYLLQAGVDPNRLILIGNGSSKPLKDNTIAEGRKYNRRVDVFFRIVEN